MDFKKARLLVTGGAGFIGSHFVEYWLNRYARSRVTVLDALTYSGNKENLKEAFRQRRFRFVRGNIQDRRIVAQLIEGADIVVNFAAETHVDRSIQSAGDFVRTDVLGTYTLLEALRHARKTPELFMQISTDEVFGSVRRGTFTARSPFLPNSPYSASKAGGDLLCRAFYETYKLPIITTHSSNVYGPRQYPEKIIPLFITNLLMDMKVPLYNYGRNVREWLYVDDYCRALNTVMLKSKPGEKVLIGSGERLSNFELTNKILNAFGKDSSWIEHVTDRPGHDARYALNHSWLTREGWRPRVKFDLGLRKTIAWYRDNEAWWRPIRNKMKRYYLKQYKK